MLDRQVQTLPTKPPIDPAPATIDVGLRQLLGFFRRRRKTMVVTVLVMMALAILYLVTATPKYTATTALLIDTHKLSIFSQGDVVSESVISNATLETQVQILQSGKLAEAVVKKLDLIHDADFMAESPGLIGSVMNFIGGLFASSAPQPPPTEAYLTRQAVSELRQNLSATRIGLSVVINVAYTDTDMFRAAQISNAYTAVYVEDQLNTQVATAQRGSEWLLSRIEELRNQSTADNLTAQEKSAVRATYDDFLQRYTQTVQQQSLPMTEARAITTPVRGSQTSPNFLLVAVGAIFGGGMLGFGIALARDLLDQAIRTRKQVETATAGPFLGYLPKVKGGGFIRRQLARYPGRPAEVGGQRFVAGPDYSVSLTAPSSRFTETLRGVKLAVDKACPAGRGCVLGVVSAVPKEGRTTVAINLARLVAHSGGRALLIDADLRSGALSRGLVPAKAPGLVQLVHGDAQLADVIWSDKATRLHFLPAGIGLDGADPNEVLTSASTQALLEACRRQYGLVIVDLPAILPVVDVQSVAHLFDSFLFVAEWGRTSADVLGQAFRVDGIEEKAVGTVLTKVRTGALRRYQDRATEVVVRRYADAYRQIA